MSLAALPRVTLLILLAFLIGFSAVAISVANLACAQGLPLASGCPLGLAAMMQSLCREDRQLQYRCLEHPFCLLSIQVSSNCCALIGGKSAAAHFLQKTRMHKLADHMS
jgi:hypothetical protein